MENELDYDYATQNLFEAAYCYYQGLSMVGKKSSGYGKTLVYFKGENAKQIAMEYYKSEFKNMSDAYRTVKDFAFQK